jgi:hypothetical protein
LPLPSDVVGLTRRFGRRLPPAVVIAMLAVTFRLWSAALALFTNVVFPDYQREQFTVFGSTSPFWDSFARYDSGWYFQIARFGYHYTPGGRDTIAFFPVYPMLMRYIGRLFGRAPADLYIGGMFVSWAAFAIAMIGLYKLARLDFSQRRAGRATLLAAIFPFAFFYGAVYTEATFLAASIWTFYGFRNRRWVLGGLCGAIATATRVNGIMMWPALAWIVWQLAWRRDASADSVTAGRQRLWSAIGLALAGTGVGLYSLFVYQLSGNPFEWAAAMQRWGYSPGGAPWLALYRLVSVLIAHPYAYLSTGNMAPYDTLNGLAAVTFVAAVPFIWYKHGAGYGLFMAANLWLPLSSGQYEGIGRYCAVLFPFFIWVAGATSRSWFTAIVVIFAMLYTLCMALFVNIHPLF